MNKLIKLLVVTLIISLLYYCKDFFIPLVKIINILKPLVIGFILAYMLYPLMSKIKIPKFFSILIIEIFLLILIILIFKNIIPIGGDLVKLFESLSDFIYTLSIKYNFDFLIFNEVIDVITDYILNKLILNNPLETINFLSNFIFGVILIIVSNIYFLNDMDKIINHFNRFEIFKEINSELRKYFNTFSLVILITFLEYSICYLVIGHGSALFLGLIASLGNLIPFLGSILVHIIAYILVYNDSTMIVPLIVILVVTLVLDNFIINPLIYSKKNKIHPLVVIVSLFVGNVLFGFYGIFITLPVIVVSGVLYKNRKKYKIMI